MSTAGEGSYKAHDLVSQDIDAYLAAASAQDAAALHHLRQRR